jgi:hypothetical protein
MLTQVARAGRVAFAAVLALCLIPVASCDKVPLTAPSGTVITLFPTATTVPLNGEIEIVATAIENGVAAPPTTPAPPPGTPPTQPTTPAAPTPGAGTPVHNGTLISFTTTLGRIEPSEARTSNGQVRVRFIAGGQSGLASISAFSGGAVGRLADASAIKVGTAAVERVSLTADPQTLGPSGGTTQLAARVEDITGFGVAGVPVTFSTTQGQFSANPANTDSNGVARTALSTTREASVNVTVAGKTLAAPLVITLTPRTGIAITPPAGSIPAIQPATFTIAVAATSNIREVRVNWGDGSSQSLGALGGSTNVVHVYNEPGTYTVTATATDASGFTETVSTTVNVTPAQPPGVTLTISDTTPALNQQVIITAQVSGATSAIIRYEWQFGSNVVADQSTTGNRVTASWNTVGTKTIVVRAIQAVGPFGEGFGTVDVGTTTVVGQKK